MVSYSGDMLKNTMDPHAPNYKIFDQYICVGNIVYYIFGSLGHTMNDDFET